MVPDIAKKGHSFNGAFAYYLHDKGADTAERVGWTETRNLMTDDPQGAKQIMIATALQADELKKAAGIKAAGRKSTQSVYAYALSWHPDEAEKLDKAEMLAAADASLKELKADHLQAVIVCHTDQKHPHVHVIINRVDPADGRMHPFKNDRLKLSDWANQYERDRGNIVTPAREEKRQKRERYQDKKDRQDFALAKRQEAEARAKSDLSPAAMLKDLGEAQKVRHRQEWKNLSTTNKANRNAIFDEHRKRIKDAAALHRKETKPFWAAHFAKERDRKKTYDKREANLIGVIQNAFEATSQQYVMGELDGRGKLSAHFSNVISSQKRRAVFERRLDLDKQTLRGELKAILDHEVQSIQGQRKDALKDQRASFDDARTSLIQRQDDEWGKVREAWKQLRGRSYSSYQRSSDPVKKDFDKTRSADPATPKPQPTRKAVVSSPSPMPAPKGEVPRVSGKTQTVAAKDWSKTPVQADKGGLGGVAPAKKDWAKTGASKQPVSQPKDWGKKAERSGAAKKPPAPRRDMDRSR